MAERETLQARQAALLLHGLPAESRQQVIGRLSPSESFRVQALLDELNELGVSPALGAQLRSLAGATSPPSLAQERVAGLSASTVLRCIQVCAPETAAVLLAARDWSWKQDVLDQMARGHRARVLECMRNRRSRLTRTVLDVLCECLYAHATAKAANNREPRTIAERLKRWIVWKR